MFKKAIPFIIVSGLVLTACNDTGNNGNDVPNNNETPMENMDDGNNMTPRVNDGAGPDMDGIDDGLDGNNGGNGGIINDDNDNNGIINDDRNNNDGILTDDDNNNRNNNENNTNNR